MEVREGYHKTDIGVIPNDWHVEAVQEAFDICNNLRLPISEDVRNKMQGEYPYYGPTKIQDYINEYRVEGEYALIGEDGDHFLKWSDIPMTQIVSGKFNVNNHAHIVKGKANITLTRWFYYFFKHRDITQHLLRQGAGRYKLNKSTLKEIKCAFPPSIEEQIEITDTLGYFDALTAKLEKLIEKKRAIKQGAMQELLKPKKGWVVKKLSEVIINFQNGYGFSAIGYVKEGIPIVTMAQIGLDGSFNFNETKANNWVHEDFESLKSFHLKNGDLIIAMTDVTPEKNLIGRMAIVKSNQTLLLNQRVGHLRLDPIKANAYCLKTLSNMRSWRTYCIGSASLGVQANIGTKDILNGEIVLPKIDEQNEIARILSDMDDEIAAMEQKLSKYKMLKQGMTQELLTGKIRLI